DPYIKELSNVETLDEALNGTFAILLATAHKQFRALTGQKLSEFGIKIVIDGRNFLDKQDILKHGIYYKGIGR
ncbi:MAG: UDP binding domain-containing protein, partial [Candidatus Kapaibacteriota bacterium]